MPDQPENANPATQTTTESAALRANPEGPPTGTTSQSVVSTTAEKKKRRWLMAVADGFRAFIPEKVSKLEGKYGPALLAGFCIGLVIGIVFAVGALMGSESLRTVLLPPPAKDTAVLPGSIPPEKIGDINFVEVDSAPLFFQDYERLLAYIGKAEQLTKDTDNPPMGAVVHEISKPTQSFSFPLEPRFTGSQIYAYLFRQSNVGSRNLFEPLISLPGSNVNKITFKVPECNAGDKLFMFVLVIPPAQHSNVDKFTDYFRTGPPE